MAVAELCVSGTTRDGLVLGPVCVLGRPDGLLLGLNEVGIVCLGSSGGMLVRRLASSSNVS